MTEKIDIALDLDDVVFGYLAGLRKYMRENYEIEFGEDPTSFNLMEAGWFDTIEDFKKYHGEAVNNGLYASLEPFDNVSDILWDLSDSGYRINIITSRFINPGQHAQVVNDTIYALEKNRIPFSSILFLHNKTKFLADIYIDDSPVNLLPLQDLGRETITFSQNYNQNVPGLRADNWVDIRKILFKKFGK